MLRMSKTALQRSMNGRHNVLSLDFFRFAVIWKILSSNLYNAAQSRVVFEPPPLGLSSKSHTTLVGRLPEELSSTIIEAVQPLRSASGEHYFYPASTIHVTVRNFDLLAQRLCSQEVVAEKVQEFISGFSEVRMRAKGLNVSPTTVFVQLFPCNKDFKSLRRGLNEMEGRQFAECSFGHLKKDLTAANLLMKNMAFANVMRFAGVLSPSVVKYVSVNRWRDFGEFSLRELELVSTDRYLSSSGTKIIKSFSLTGNSR
ncbi:MAG: hypothetical protein QM766_03865 [Burkholderiaceae bacterium]